MKLSAAAFLLFAGNIASPASSCPALWEPCILGTECCDGAGVCTQVDASGSGLCLEPKPCNCIEPCLAQFSTCDPSSQEDECCDGTVCSQVYASGAGVCMEECTSDNQLIFRMIGSNFPDEGGCYQIPYFDKEGEERLGMASDCVTSDIVPLDEFGTILQFQVTTTFTPDDEDEDKITTQCIVTVRPSEDQPGMSTTECFNEDGVLTSEGGSVMLDGLVDITQLAVTGEAGFNCRWTISLNED